MSVISVNNIAVTGASGFLGKALVRTLKQSPKYTPVPMIRKGCANDTIEIDLSTSFEVAKALRAQQVEVLVHCAARAHILNDAAQSPINEYREVNTHATIRLAQQAAAAGVKRFIFISTAKVNGERSELGHPMTEFVVRSPIDPYAISKYEAEVALAGLAEDTGMEIVIIRPPLVYGSGVKANFAALMKLSQTALPLPFGAIDNQRSLISLENLIDIICCCLEHPSAANQTFLVSDDDDVSTTELIKELANAYENRIKLLPIPTSILGGLLKVLGKKNIAERMFGNLQFDISHAKQTLNWTPPYSFKQGILKLVKDSEAQ
ncbi:MULTISPECIES: NAD-dependent epimerase/dehydratase family protein [Vibrio]|uniref:NAD-dependent epimerase/dehydratase family protein n=1 Tax=Vibrio mediterranei TaxID=689 RepID=A0A3G4V912_9VIBR|nr:MULTISPECIES: NAD-dependent epimerase/dehydratase family protein [Vibrio]AYV21210.1 NAD-dependent epimerase/dehydratase family protein [Vibrio mediterranei]USE00330.1 NAD-dependent epimerase/dehydratase family protein [Vibrio sp. SCSIO 43133]